MKEKLKKTTISIDTEVWAEINHRLRIGTRDDKNKVLRRLLGLDKDGILVIEGETYHGTEKFQICDVVLVNKNSLYKMLNTLFQNWDWQKNPRKVRVTIEEVK